MPKRTYIDTNVLIAAFQGKGPIGQAAFGVLDDPTRCLVVSQAVLLEAYPKAHYEKRQLELDFYDTTLAAAEVRDWDTKTLDRAHEIAKRYGIDAMDAIHVATAIDSQVEELVTAEKPTKPMFRVKELQIKTLSTNVTTAQAMPNTTKTHNRSTSELNSPNTAVSSLESQ